MALKWFGGGGYELFKHKFVNSLNQELVKLKRQRRMLKLRNGLIFGLMVLMGGCQLVGPKEGVVLLEARPAQVVVSNQTGVSICVWMIDLKTLVVADIEFSLCLEPNVGVDQTKAFSVYVPEDEAGVDLVVFWAKFQQERWYRQQIWVPGRSSVAAASAGQ